VCEPVKPSPFKQLHLMRVCCTPAANACLPALHAFIPACPSTPHLLQHGAESLLNGSHVALAAAGGAAPVAALDLQAGRAAAGETPPMQAGQDVQA
jgi:hypothetical protein